MYRVKKIFKSLSNNRLILFFLLITVLGLALRIVTAFSKDIFTDEIFYTEVSRLKSFSLIIQIHLWLLDHGQLYLVFLKIVQNLTTNVVFLRLSNLFLYVILNFSIFKFFNKFQKGLISLFPVFLFSFLPYFVYLNSYISPYNFVMFFSILAFLFMSDFILSYSVKENRLKDSILFLIFSSLAFYSDYSVIYFYLSLIPIILLVFKWNQKLVEDLTIIFCLNWILILPGLYQLFSNFQYFYSLNSPINYLNNDFLTYINNFTNIIFFNPGQNVSLLILVTLFILITVIFIKSKNNKLIKFLSFVFLSGFLINITFLYIFNSSFFFIFTERTFWYFYFLLVLGLSAVMIYLQNFKKTYILFFSLVVLLVGFKYINSYKIDPILGQNVNYKELVNNLFLNKNLKNKSLIVLFDETNSLRYVPLREYYFKALDKTDKRSISIVNNYFRNKQIELLQSFSDIYTQEEIKDKETVAFIIFDWDNKKYSELKNALNAYEQARQIRTTNIFYRLKCQDNNCNFYQSK